MRNREYLKCPLIQKYQTALGIQEPERSYTTGNSPPLVSALLAARPQRGVRPFSYVCTDTNQFSRTSLMFSSSVQRGPHVAECDLLRGCQILSARSDSRWFLESHSAQFAVSCQNSQLSIELLSHLAPVNCHQLSLVLFI